MSFDSWLWLRLLRQYMQTVRCIFLLRTKSAAVLVKGDRGAVESALVLIPSLILFLGVLQIGGSVMARMTSGSSVQSQVSKVALLDSTASPAGIALAREPLPGGGEILLGTQHSNGPAISPLLLGSDGFDAFGVAVNENQ